VGARSRRIGFIIAAATVSACAAVLGIEDRLPLDGTAAEAGTADGAAESGGDSAPDTGGDGGATDAPFDISVIPDAECTPATCAAAGGTCVTGACQFNCGAGCATSTMLCPANTDCQILCAKNGCGAAKCVGGHSCTFECADTNCAAAACESARCAFRCGANACDNVSCDAGVSCTIDCSGGSSCDNTGGIHAQAGETCAINCTGASSCGGGSPSGANSPIRCSAPDSSIVCGNATDTCKDGIPTCNGTVCTINCVGNSSCEDGYCCDAGTCNKLGQSATNLCN